jgi:hypothetical protein
MYEFEVILEDNGQKIASTLFSLLVQRVNDPPSITTTPALLEINAGDSLQVEILAEDMDLASGGLKWSLLDSPEFALIENDTGRLILTPGEEETGFHEIIIRVEDPEGAGDDLVFAVLVKGEDTGPDIKDWEFNGTRVKVIPVEISSEVWYDEPYYLVDDSSMTIYYPFKGEEKDNPDDNSAMGYIALFVIVVSVITLFIHMFLRRQ